MSVLQTAVVADVEDEPDCNTPILFTGQGTTNCNQPITGPCEKSNQKTDFSLYSSFDKQKQRNREMKREADTAWNTDQANTCLQISYSMHEMISN